MSTFKRLFNVGKGKAKTAQRDLGDALSGNADKPTEWVDKARHTAADAAEAVAGALRPEDRRAELPRESRVAEPGPREAATAPRTVRASRAEPVDEDGPLVEDAEEVASGIEQASGKPRKRTL